MGRQNSFRVILALVMVGIVMVGVFGPVGVKQAWACSCRYLSPSEAFREADVVFSGHVAKNTGAGLLSRSVTFTVTESWKGVSTSRVTVYSTGDSGSCGFPFAVGTAYLVYGREVNGRLFTSLCTRTSSVSMPRVKDDFAYLNSWARFAPGSGGLTLDMICFGGSGLILLVSAIGYLLFRRRRMAAEMDG